MPSTYAFSQSDKLDIIIDEIGFGKFHVIAIIGLGWRIFDRASMFCLITLLEPYFRCKFNLSYIASSLYTSSVLISAALSSPLTGWLADTFGKRKTLLLFFSMSITTALLNVLSSSFLMITLTMACCGLFHNAQYFVYPYLLEFFSKSKRKCVTFIEIFYVAGLVLTGIVTKLCVENLSWQWAVVFCLIFPLIVALITMGNLPESPRYLLAKGEVIATVESLVQVAAMNMSNVDELELGRNYLWELSDNRSFEKIDTDNNFVNGSPSKRRQSVKNIQSASEGTIYHDFQNKLPESKVSGDEDENEEKSMLTFFKDLPTQLDDNALNRPSEGMRESNSNETNKICHDKASQIVSNKEGVLFQEDIDDSSDDQREDREKKEFLDDGNATISMQDITGRILVVCLIRYCSQVYRSTLRYASGQNFMHQSSEIQCNQCTASVSVTHLISFSIGTTFALLLTYALLGHVKRRLAMKVLVTVLFIMILPFYFKIPDWLMTGLYFCGSVPSECFYIVMNLYGSEVVPSSVRGFSVGLMTAAMVSGELTGSILATYFLHVYPRFALIFVHINVTVCLIVVFRYAIETKHMSLN